MFTIGASKSPLNTVMNRFEDAASLDLVARELCGVVARHVGERDNDGHLTWA